MTVFDIFFLYIIDVQNKSIMICRSAMKKSAQDANRIKQNRTDNRLHVGKLLRDSGRTIPTPRLFFGYSDRVTVCSYYSSTLQMILDPLFIVWGVYNFHKIQSGRIIIIKTVFPYQLHKIENEFRIIRDLIVPDKTGRAYLRLFSHFLVVRAN